MSIKLIWKNRRIVLIALVLVIAQSFPAFGFADGLSITELEALNQYPQYVTTSVGSCTVTSGTVTTSAPPSEFQKQNAKIIIGVAKTENLGKQAALIALMVGNAESSLIDSANSTVPPSESSPNKQNDPPPDADSVGIFQQRPSQNWSTLTRPGDSASQDDNNQAAVWQLMDPAYSAEAFFGSTNPDSPSPLRKGLVNHTGWESKDPWVVAQSIQASAYSDGRNYKKRLPESQSLIDQLWNSSPPVPLPIPLAAGATVANSTTSSIAPGCGTGGNSSVAQAVIQAGLAEIVKNIPYHYGAGGPDGPSGSPAGFDCSSFMQYVFKQGAGLAISRTAQSQYNDTVGKGNSVDYEKVQPGDLLFFGSSPSNIGHVNMYIGNGMIMEAPHTGLNIRTTKVYKVADAGSGEVLQGVGFYPPVGG